MHAPPPPVLTFLEPYDRSIQDLALAVRGEKIESSKNATGERTYRIAK